MTQPPSESDDKKNIQRSQQQISSLPIFLLFWQQMGCFFPTVLVFFLATDQVRPLEEEKVRPLLQFVGFTLKVAGSQSKERGKIQIIQIHKIANTNTNMGRSIAAICHSWCKCKREDICKITFGIYLESSELKPQFGGFTLIKVLK